MVFKDFPFGTGEFDIIRGTKETRQGKSMIVNEAEDPVGQVLSIGDVVQISDFAAEFEIGESYDVSGLRDRKSVV